ncbi:MAG: SDR family oxidoreductase [Candidatus Thioglobus sp.]|nr:SDR family oxidoreductase [Candidatus Thioglobus sp.]|tara:strand:- start:2576 stop:3346 length:771 start_codon:yes stop_codon:yes gene_type:complete
MNNYATFKDLENTSVFITGGGSGIGASITEGFLAQGAKVAFVQRSECGEFLEEMSSKYIHKPLFIKCDITDTKSLQAAILKANNTHDGINVLINNAANDSRHSLNEMTTEEWDYSINVNLRPHFFTAQAVAPIMKAQGGGSIINFSSACYLMGNVGYPAYVASKAGITGLTRSLARELGVDGIRVNSLIPGWVLTERQMKLWANDKDLANHLEKQCIKDHLMPNDLIDSTLFLASDASRMMTGQALVIDGGVVVTG